MKTNFSWELGERKVRGCRIELRKWLESQGFNEKVVHDITLASEEVLTNILRHAYEGSNGSVNVSIEKRSDCVRIVFEDLGKRFDPTTLPDPQVPPEKPGGLGVFFVRELMDKVVYDKEFLEGNRLILEKLI